MRPESIIVRKNYWRLLLLANIAIVLWFWWHGSGSLFLQGGAPTVIALGRLAGLAAAGGVLLQFSYISRMPWLERAFGLDNLIRRHKQNGKISAIFILLHPILLTLGYAQSAQISLLEQLKHFLFGYQFVLLAAVAAGLFLAVVAISLTIVRSRLRYENWYFVHLLVYAAFFLAIWHQFANGSDLLFSRIFYSYWVLLYVFVLLNHGLFRLIRPIWLYRRHGFYVDRVVPETYNVTSVYIAGRRLDVFKIKPGQFMFFRFLTKGRWWQAHPFSLSFVPDGRRLRISVKSLGDFTEKIKFLKPGTKVIIDGPYGIFTADASASEKILLIAGGIGITPLRALFEQMLRLKKNVVMLFGNKTKADVTFRQELEGLVRKLNGRVVHILSGQADYQGETGQIDAGKIGRLVPDWKERDVYVCGPVGMMDAVIGDLKKSGIDPSRLHFEKFEL